MAVPAQNVDHIVVQAPFHRIRDLIEALRESGVLPKSIPARGGWGEHHQPIPRFDIDFVIRYRIKLGTLFFDAYRKMGAPGANEIRLGVPIQEGSIRLATLERSTGRELSNFEYAISGRLAVFGSLETDPVTKSVFFVISRLPEFKLDDRSDRVPPELSVEATEKLLSRVGNREIRARTSKGGRSPQLRFPVTSKLREIGSAPATFGYALRDIEQITDPFATPICLPSGFGDPDCGSDPPPLPVLDRFQNLDLFARVATHRDPVTIFRTGKHFQVDIGWKIIQREISKSNGWKDEGLFAAKMFKYSYGYWINWSSWPGGGHDDAGIKAEVRANLQIAYPKIKWCKGWTKLPWGGHISYKYPCGIELGWNPVKETHAWVTVRLRIQDNLLCIERTDVGASGRTDIIGFIIMNVYAGALIGFLGMFSSLLAQTFSAIWFLFNFIILALERIIELLARILPNEICSNIENFLKIPLVEDRIRLDLSEPVLLFKNTGITIGVNGDFKP